jgi:hypothetical protein
MALICVVVRPLLTTRSHTPLRFLAILHHARSCILQKHNCRGLNAEPPALPDPAPMATFRGQPLTFEAADEIKRGWLAVPNAAERQPWSWLVAGGVNSAYDAFPCQHQVRARVSVLMLCFCWRRVRAFAGLINTHKTTHTYPPPPQKTTTKQLYYPEKTAFWYEPVFKVITLNGDAQWRRRKYRVRRGKSTPGTWNYSVLDNGITSSEHWRLIDAAEDLSWVLFYYTGAASRAGMSYSGAVLGTKDGAWPSAHGQAARVEAALARAGIMPWEVSRVDNSNCAGAPLELEAAAAVAA